MQPDDYLTGWWILLAITVATSLAFVGWAKRIKARPLAPAGGSRDLLLTPFGPPLRVALVGFALTLPWAALFIGGVALIARSDWTELHVLTSSLSIAFLGLWTALYFYGETRRLTRLKRLAARTAIAPVPLLLILAGILPFLGDAFGARRVVEGDLTGRERRAYKPYAYELIIDGRRYRATREVFLRASAGDRVRISIGAGSDIVFGLEQSPPLAGPTVRSKLMRCRALARCIPEAAHQDLLAAATAGVQVPTGGPGMNAAPPPHTRAVPESTK